MDPIILFLLIIINAVQTFVLMASPRSRITARAISFTFSLVILIILTVMVVRGGAFGANDLAVNIAIACLLIINAIGIFYDHLITTLKGEDNQSDTPTGS